MRKLVALCAAALLLGVPSLSAAGPIVTVATASLEMAGDFCSEGAPGECLATFTLEYLWPFDPGYSALAPATLNGEFTATIEGMQYTEVFLPLPNDLFGTVVYVDRYFPPVTGVPSSASASISFDFMGSPYNFTKPFDLSALFSPGGLVVPFEFELPDDVTVVPEPSTLSLVALGLLARKRVWNRIRRSRAS